jgi:hypothetical protein
LFLATEQRGGKPGCLTVCKAKKGDWTEETTASQLLPARERHNRVSRGVVTAYARAERVAVAML